jgi:two-component system, response regulator RpfG
MLQNVLSKSDMSIGARICGIHEQIRHLYPALCRIAVAVYDKETNILKTFVHSTDGASPISFYESSLSNAKSLQEVSDKNAPRIIDDLSTFSIESIHIAKRYNFDYIQFHDLFIRF